MKTKTILQWGLLLVLSLGVMGAECPSIPTIEDRVVELVMGASATVRFEARGHENVFGRLQTIDLVEGIDLRKLLDDAGVDVSDVMGISLYGVSYRVVKSDPQADRAIQNGQVMVGRGETPNRVLIQDFNEEPVNAVVDWKPADLHPDGVELINDLLDEYLNAVRYGSSLPTGQVSCLPSGVSTPDNVSTDFDWELKIDINVVGQIKVKVLG